MARVLLTYDVKTNHVEIKKALLKLGWKDSIVGTGDDNITSVTCHLANTTFWKDNTTAQEARDIFKTLTTMSNVDRVMCYEFTNWQGISGEPHSDNRS